MMMNNVALYIQQASHEVLDVEEERELIERISEGDNEAKEELIENNLRLVIRIARSYESEHHSLDLLDLIQEGNKGLTLAAEKVDPSFDNKFSTYATHYISRKIQRGIKNAGDTIRIPVHIQQKRNELEKNFAMLTNELGRQPNNKELAEALDWSREEVEKLLRQTRPCDSLNKKLIDQEDSSRIIDMIEDDSKRVDKKDNLEEIREKIDDSLSQLSDRKRKILELRYGLFDGRTRTLRELESNFDVSYEQIRQLEKQALNSLRQQGFRNWRKEADISLAI